MKREQMRNIFERLARSQGMWGRLLRNIDEADPADREAFWQDLESREFKDSLDLILFIENGE